jgi:hypothetical protein
LEWYARVPQAPQIRQNMGPNCISGTAEEEAKRHKDKKAKKHKKEKKERKSRNDEKEKELLKAAKKFLKTSALKPYCPYEKAVPYSHMMGTQYASP